MDVSMLAFVLVLLLAIANGANDVSKAMRPWSAAGWLTTARQFFGGRSGP